MAKGRKIHGLILMYMKLLVNMVIRVVQTRLEPKNPTKPLDVDSILARTEAQLVGGGCPIPRTNASGLSGRFTSLKLEQPKPD